MVMTIQWSLSSWRMTGFLVPACTHVCTHAATSRECLYAPGSIGNMHVSTHGLGLVLGDTPIHLLVRPTCSWYVPTGLHWPHMHASTCSCTCAGHTHMHLWIWATLTHWEYVNTPMELCLCWYGHLHPLLAGKTCAHICTVNPCTCDMCPWDCAVTLWLH